LFIYYAPLSRVVNGSVILVFEEFCRISNTTTVQEICWPWRLHFGFGSFL